MSATCPITCSGHGGRSASPVTHGLGGAQAAGSRAASSMKLTERPALLGVGGNPA
jgi:hypothetical protein